MENFFPIFLFCISSMVTPGPNNIMIMSSGLNFGIKHSLPHYLGICFGFPMMVLTVGLGMGAIFMQFPMIQGGIKIIGAVYMLFLSWQIARAHVRVNKYNTKNPITFFKAVLFQWINPKAWVMAIGAVATYTNQGENFFLQLFMICLLFLIIGFPSIGAWLFCGTVLKRFLKSDKHQRYFNYSLGALLAISVILIFID
jgi:threonine/homoserine/homoserine lactone efflux protein